MSDILESVKLAKAAVEDKKGEKIVILDISELSPIADYFLIASCNNVNQLHAIADEIENRLSKAGAQNPRVEGYNGANWILMDYGDFMIHLFTVEAREFYNLDRVWQDAAKVE